MPHALADAEVRRLLRCITNPIHRTCFAVMYACGLRIGEAATLEIGTIDGDNGLLRIIGKGNKERRSAARTDACEPASVMEDPQEPTLAVPHARRHQPGRPRHAQSHLRGRRRSGRYRFGDTPQSSPRICDTAA